MFLITKKLLKSIEDRFQKFDEQYQFDKNLYVTSRRECKVIPYGMEILWKSLIEKEHLMSDNDLYKAFLNSPDLYVSNTFGYERNFYIKCRCRQFWTGFLREVDVALKLNNLDNKCKIYKSLKLDLGKGGVDIIYINKEKNKEIYFAIKMGNNHMDKDAMSIKERKDSKAWNKVVQVFAQTSSNNPNGLAKVSEETLKKYL